MKKLHFILVIILLSGVKTYCRCTAYAQPGAMQNKQIKKQKSLISDSKTDRVKQKPTREKKVNAAGDFRTQMNFIYEKLDKSKVPTGLLRDYAMEFVNLENFNGKTPLTDSNYGHANSFWQVYNTLISARIHSNATGLVHGDTVDNLWYSQRKPGLITLCGLFFTYAHFKDNAQRNCITIKKNQLHDRYINGIWQNPYLTAQTFLISPSIIQYNEKKFSLLLPGNLWLTNSGGNISIDVNDGFGYRKLIPGIPLNVEYASNGLKEWTYRLQTKEGEILYAHSLLAIGNPAANH